jgi:predicted  nucleic acid-binding Zn-ribbon protein
MIWNPWRKIRELQADLDKATRERNDFEFELSRACDRYDKVREMNTQLRDALSLYRNA